MITRNHEITRTVYWFGWLRPTDGKPDARALNRAFTGRKKLAMGVVKLALEVNFRDFFDGVDLAGLTTPKP